MRNENTYAKFQREIRKIDEDTAIFVEQHLCSTRRLYARIANDEKAVFRRKNAEELLYSPGIPCDIRVNNLNLILICAINI